MSVSLEKGQKVDLTKGSASKQFYVGLGWDAQSLPGAPEYDIDVSAVILGSNGKVITDNHFVFYNNLNDPETSVTHTGDNLTGQGDGDDESVIVNLDKINANATEISIVLTIHDAAARNQNFGSVKNAFIRVCNANSDGSAGTELMRFDLSEDYSLFTALHVGSVYLNNGEWKFEAVGQGFKADLRGLLGHYGVSVG